MDAFFFISPEKTRLAKVPFDPELLPVEAIAGEPALPPERLTAPWLRARFAQACFIGMPVSPQKFCNGPRSQNADRPVKR